ncbi:MAG TPA: arylesterase [Burkholderiaceae bacterium]|nr:arylesterase [Burkholderiaceae bacterium]
MRWGRSLGLLLGLLVSLYMRGAMAAEAAAPQEADPHAGRPARQILIVGDSLSAEYGLPRDTGWVQIIAQRLKRGEQAYQIRNASISGDTTGNGLQRLPALLEETRPDIVVIQLGANDGLRGLPLRDMKANLQKMIALSRAKGAQVLLIGQHIPPNYGRRYADQFHAIYAELAKENAIPLVPFMLEGIALEAGMFQADGLHPTVEAQTPIADTIWPHLEALL